MDNAKYQEAKQAYDAGDYRSAAKLFLASAGRGAEGNGAAYHMAGNSLMRLRRHSDAIAVYAHALRDETFGKRGAVFANLGAARVALGDLSEALEAYQSALEEPDYQTTYKAWLGIAAIHMDRGRVEDAAVAYRKAALDEKNPHQAKALVNLGLCLMILGRPEDAVDAYQAALGFDNYDGRGRALANLGQAFVALGRYDDAVKAFKKSTELHGHVLSKAAADAYETAATQTAAAESVATESTPEAEVVEGWETGQLPFQAPANDPEPDPDPDPEEAWPGPGLTDSIPPLDAEPESPTTSPSETGSFIRYEDEDAEKAAESLGMGDDAAVSTFFSMTEDEMKTKAREARRSDSGAAHTRLVRRVITGVVVLVIALGVIVGGYFAGLGWPTQQSVVSGMFKAYSSGSSVDSYWVAVPNTDVKREMAKIPPVKGFVVNGIDRGRQESTARVTVTPRDGSVMHYIVKLVREGVGWRVSGLDYDWSSSGG